MKELKTRKEQLQKELNAISKAEDAEIIKEHYPVIKKKFEGKFFKRRNNYSHNKQWWLYTKVTEIKPSDIYNTMGNGVTSHYKGWSFETTTSKQVDINQKETGYVHSLGKEITKKEFSEAWDKMIKNLPTL